MGGIIIKIFIVNGKGGCGKTSFEKMIEEIAAAHNQKILILSIKIEECYLI